MFRLLEHDYIGLSENRSMDISEKSSRLNLKETELRLGLPGCESPERKSTNVISLFGKDLQNTTASKNIVAGSKRGFCDAIKEGSSRKWVFQESDNESDDAIVGLEGKRNNTHKAPQSAKLSHDKKHEVSATHEHASPPSAKAQVVGWPPIRSYRRNTMACSLTKNNDDEEEGKPEACGCLYVKVSMDGAPYLRKVDLSMYTDYMQLSSALEQMFTCFTVGECASGGFPGKDGLSESSLRDLLHVSEYVVTYEDKDGDWMLVGDVPWEMFTESCRRLRIMKGSEAIGLAPRAVEKCRSQNNWRRIR
ncbi:auxin-responsive protein IAA27-like [Neltuma alba]|uniref:auxin-responsive protein IAA27-like n=1 Tax=Neltuma alba TaxID=207710 RepID=UPI0010A3BE20|nr:auxin-responsive protein IAA27-like [Prosopis alba]